MKLPLIATKDYWWLSFVGDDGWLGATVVQAPSLPDAIDEAWKTGCNPGGEVACCNIPEGGFIPDAMLWHLITTKAELEALFKGHDNIVRVHHDCLPTVCPICQQLHNDD